MKTVIVASENPVKVAVARRAFESVYPTEGFEFVAVKSESGVGDQPVDEETKLGAYNRLVYIKKLHPKADFWISQEGGVCADGDRLFNRAWIMVADSNGNEAASSTSSFYLPTIIAKQVQAGVELGTASDQFFRAVNSKQGIGTTGYITDGLLPREDYYLHSAIIAVSQIKHHEWYV